MNKIILLLLISLAYNTSAFAQKQSKKDKAKEIAKIAIEKMDNGELEESIKLLEEAQKLDKTTSIYPYEIAYATYKKGDYQKAIDILKKIIHNDDAEDEYYRLLGNSYDSAGNGDKAIEIYSEGIKKFPEKSGKFYSESGLVQYNQKKYNEAIEFWEKGIKEDPNYASNYYWLTTIFSLTEENIWTLFYGELFMNLEQNTKRTETISTLLYDTYQKIYVAKNETEGEFFMTKNTTLTIGNEKDGSLNFELTYLFAYAAEANFTKGITIQNIYEAKKGFLSFWFDIKKFNKDFPNSLLDFEKKMKEDNVLEAYTYWFLSEGNPKEFQGWYLGNKDKFDKFANWVKTNQINLKKEDKYSRLDYSKLH